MPRHADNVQVAVRVRPFNARETTRGASCCIAMHGNVRQTVITNPESGATKSFTFDRVYNSFVPAGHADHASQDTVWDELGGSVLDAAFEGFNVSLFAYGQTGSGKSYSMMGPRGDRGIIPRAGEVIFARIAAEGADAAVTYKVECSMLEIYNERVRDLFAQGRGGERLRIRDHPRKGPYAEDLSTHAVSSYEQVERLMEVGVAARTVAATQMNETSSRAHTIFSMVFTQTRMDRDSGKATDKVSRINLIDLAGSERARSTGATGDRLKEGAAINTSLSALGKVITALASNATLKKGKKPVLVPYRDSVLTHLLKNSLGGNAKTIMIAALSPASINYDETLSTLRYADRAKQIKNKAVVNEDPNERLLRELREEMEALRSQVAAGSDVAELRAQLAENERMLRESEKTWEERLAETQAQQAARAAELERAGLGRDASTEPHLCNLNQDPALTGMLRYALREGETRLGNKKGRADVELGGLDILPEHAVATRQGAAVTLAPVGEAKVSVNGRPTSAPVQLAHNDRVILGNNLIFRFVAPPEPEDESVDWEFAMAEANAAEMQAISSQMADAEREKEAMAARIAELEARMAAEAAAAEAEADRQRAEWEAQLRSGAMDLEQQRAREQALREEQAQRERELQARLAAAEAEAAANQRRDDDRRVLEELLLRTLPLVREANAIAATLGKRMTFQVKLVSASRRGELRTELGVLVTGQDSGAEALWSHDKFSNRLYLMREMYFAFVDGDLEQEYSDENDPFFDPPDEAVLVGVARFNLEPIKYLMDVDEGSIIVDYKGKEEGKLLVTLTPDCSEVDDLDAYEEIGELLGRSLTLEVEVKQALGLPRKLVAPSAAVHVSFALSAGDFEEACTSAPAPLTSINPAIGWTTSLSVPITPELVAYLGAGVLEFSVYASSCAALSEVGASSGAASEAGDEFGDEEDEEDEVVRLRRELAESQERERALQAQLDAALKELSVLRGGSGVTGQLQTALAMDRAYNELV